MRVTTIAWLVCVGLLASLTIMGGAANAAPLWTPAEITTELWLDAADAGTVTESSGQVSQWDDKSGNARNATQTTGANQPDYVLGEQNGLNIMRLNGSTEFFSLGTGLDWMAPDADHVAFVVLENGNDVNIYGALTGGSGDASLHVGFSGANYRMNRWGNDWGTARTANYNSTPAYNFLRFGWDEGGQKYVWANAKKEADSGTHVASGLSAMAGGGSIGNVVGQGYLDADLGEFVILSTAAPPQDDVDKIEGYLAWKWGLEGNLPSGHPYESAAPVIPEPSTLCLGILGLLGLLGFTRRRR